MGVVAVMAPKNVNKMNWQGLDSSSESTVQVLLGTILNYILIILLFHKTVLQIQIKNVAKL